MCRLARRLVGLDANQRLRARIVDRKMKVVKRLTSPTPSGKALALGLREEDTARTAGSARPGSPTSAIATRGFPARGFRPAAGHGAQARRPWSPMPVPRFVQRAEEGGVEMMLVVASGDPACRAGRGWWRTDGAVASRPAAKPNSKPIRAAALSANRLLGVERIMPRLRISIFQKPAGDSRQSPQPAAPSRSPQLIRQHSNLRGQFARLEVVEQRVVADIQDVTLAARPARRFRVKHAFFNGGWNDGKSLLRPGRHPNLLGQHRRCVRSLPPATAAALACRCMPLRLADR